ncbi:type II secretion system protein GspI [bacterium]|nr:type II secretion system protein GspI [bacterium]
MHLERFMSSQCIKGQRVPLGREDGFSLVETLVALFVFAVAATAVIQLQTQSLQTFSRVERSVLAGVIVNNQLVDVRASRGDVELGVREGEAALGGVTWRWRSSVSPTADPNILMVRVDAFAGSASQPAASLTGFLPAAGGAS